MRPTGELATDVLSWIFQVVQRQGDRPAVIDRGERLSYGELWLWAERIAARLAEGGVKIGDRVGLSLDSSAAYVAALLGVWIAGAAFVPLPSDLPVVRRRRIIDEAAPRRVLCAVDLLSLRSSTSPGGQPSELAKLVQPPRRLEGTELAYVLYTSGSSGEPKGVMVSHRGILGLLRAQVAAFRLGPASRSLFVLSPAFDASISDIGTALFAGAALVIVDRERVREPSSLLHTLERESITYIDLPPALLPHIDPQALPRSLETIVIGGEPCAPAVVRRFAEVVRIVNVYGPTEATVCSSLVECEPATWTRPLLGEPLPGVFFRVVDLEGREVLAEGEGELYIGGDGLALGYLGRPELTAERFVERDGARLYRSGDRVRRGVDGSLEFLGRLDRQRKIGGVRIELGEIEAELCRHPAVVEAAVVDGPRSSLIAAVVLRCERTRRSIVVLREHLRRSLPSAALPGRIELLEALPRGASGKVDGLALAGMLRAEVINAGEAERGTGHGLAEMLRAEATSAGDAERGTGQGLAEIPRAKVIRAGEEERDAERGLGLEPVSARADREARVTGVGADDDVPPQATTALLRAIWREVLAVSHVGHDDRFCDLGGASLRALELVAAAEPHGLVLSAAALLRNPSLSELAKSLAGSTSAELRSAEELRAEVMGLASALRGGAPSPSTTGSDPSPSEKASGPSTEVSCRSREERPPLCDRALASHHSSLGPDATLLLTGATGLLGRHLAVLLSRRHRGRIIALVRAADRRRACQRLAAALKAGARSFEADDDGEQVPSLGRFELLVGDLTKPRLGLDADEWRGLSRDVDAIVHSGAVVNLAADLDMLRPANIGGTAGVLELALGGRPKLFHLISTLSVFVAASPAIAEPQESDRLDGTKAVLGGYAQSKWAAEVLAREVMRGRAPLVCHRLGLITGDTLHGVGPARDQFTFFLRGLVELGLVPEGHAALRVDISPVDSVARALGELICGGPSVSDEAPNTYHLASPNGASGAELVAALRRAGATIEPVSRQHWRKIAAERSQRSAAAAVAYLALSRCLDRRSSRELRAYDLFQATGFRFDARAADARLRPRGLSLPPVTEPLLDRYVDAALGGHR